MKIAVDAMGGDYAPLEIVKGVEKSRDQFSDMEFILFGDEAKIKAVLKDTTRVTIHHTDDMIEMGEEPVRAIRRKKNSSMVLAANAVKNGEADAFSLLVTPGLSWPPGFLLLVGLKVLIAQHWPQYCHQLAVPTIHL